MRWSNLALALALGTGTLAANAESTPVQQTWYYPDGAVVTLSAGADPAAAARASGDELSSLDQQPASFS